jgi:hypothetical protein
MENGGLQITMPAGWTAPQTTTPGAPGYVTTDHGSITPSGQQITVSGLTLFGDIVKIQYRGVVGPAGAQTFGVSQRGSSGGTLSPLASQPQLTVYAADGSGTMTANPLSFVHGTTSHTITFTYTAAAGGMSNGTVSVKIPSGWSLPSATSGPGFTTASTGTVSISGQTVQVSGVTLGGGTQMTITYGASTGATAPSTVGPKTFAAASRTTGVGVSTPLAVSPVITTT